MTDAQPCSIINSILQYYKEDGAYMTNKKSAKIFLIIGLAGVILSIIGTIIEIVYTYNIISQNFKTEPIRQSIELFEHLLWTD